jgi:hypothetical protein
MLVCWKSEIIKLQITNLKQITMTKIQNLKRFDH